MNKFSFKMKDRIKLVVERVATNSCTLTVSGKDEVVFRFSKKRAASLVSSLHSAITYGVAKEFDFRKTVKAPAGSFVLHQPTACVDAYQLIICEDYSKDKSRELISESGLSKKQVKKMIKVMKEVYGIE